MELTEKIGIGAQAEVYREGKDAVKLYHRGYPKATVFFEAALTAMVEEMGLPVARVHAVTSIDGQMALRMECIEGRELAELMREDGAHLDDYIERMVELQCRIHRQAAPALFSLKGRLRDKIVQNDCLDQAKRRRLLERLEALPDERQLCHGDFHAKNILVRDGKYFVIDWINATAGSPAADVCRTYLLNYPDNAELCQLYLRRYCEKTGCQEALVLAWLPIMAAARQAEKFAREAPMLRQWLEDV